MSLTCPSSTICMSSEREDGLCQSLTRGMHPRYCVYTSDGHVYTLDKDAVAIYTYLYVPASGTLYVSRVYSPNSCVNEEGNN